MSDARASLGRRIDVLAPESARRTNADRTIAQSTTCSPTLRAILASSGLSDSEIESGLLPALTKHTAEQFTVVESQAKNVLVTPASRVEARIVHLPPHLPYDEGTLALRSSLDKLLSSYVSNHYASGVAAVYTLPDPVYPAPEPAKEETATAPEGTGETGVDRPGRTGRWRSTYQLDYANGTLEGTAQINIHYYEQGNVQLSTTLKSSATLSSSPSPESVVASIKATESSLQRQLGETYNELSDASFRGLRRRAAQDEEQA
ncbi:hypothetical protein Rt10032_c33g6889 [Rhodotorula toruloides]|uniref:F-actin-capping protein subunit alpha n=1 Tax=Rhodotorula toruloides TaxID=5286 RepID=A0A511KR72_RHOTO|nr:hypothetical protein Rt10032_c33g6889 [Rhodotorula toruloides]